MKKILALVVAALMVFSMAAVAETADAQPNAVAVTVGNISLRVNDEDGNETEYSLGDLYYCYGIDTADGLNLIVEADQGEDTLAYLLARIVDGKLRYCFKDVDRTFEAELPEMPLVDMATIEDTIRAMLPSLLNQELGMIPAAQIPKLDMTWILESYITETKAVENVTTSSFVIPADQVASMLQMINTLAQAYAESAPQASEALKALDEIVNSGVSFQISGEIADNAEEQSVVYNIYMASGDQVAEDASLVLSTYSMENTFTLEVSLPGEGDALNTVASLGLNSNPAANTMNFTAEVAGVCTLALALDQANDLQNIALTLDAMGMAASVQCNYGIVNGEDFVAFSAAADEVGSLSVVVTGHEEDDAAYIGNADVEINAEGMKLGMSADASVVLTELELAAIEMPAEVTTEEPTEDEMQAAIEPLVEYFASIFGAEEEPAA